MKISLNWVGEFVDLDDQDPAQVAELLSLHTAEVEGLEVFGDNLREVVVGEVVECGRHPQADKLSVTRVAFGAGETVQVVCGAPNVRQGLKVAFAPVGTVLPGGLKLKKAKLRGELSMGMICSAQELELSEDHQGILELQPEAKVGQPLIEHLALADPVLELDNKSLTHRPDLWGHYGFARELAAILQRPLKPLPVLADWPEAQSEIPIHLLDPEGCPLYLGLPVELGGRPSPSPEWLQRRLLAVGQRPLSDIVDLTNFVLLELGQPTHAFDLDRLSGPEIQVRAAEEGEVLTTLDGQPRSLQAQDLVIADGSGGVALAGVMGGGETEVGDSTERILLESAVFHPVRIRRTSKRLALRTEASSRFEKSLDPALAEQALQRFAYLLAKVRPQARLMAAPAKTGQAAAPQRRLQLEPAKTSALLGLPLQAEEMLRPLQALGFQTEAKDESRQAYWVEVPSWRATKDVTLDIDLVEEVGRLAGYHRIEAVPLRAPVEAPWKDPVRNLARRLCDRMAGTHHGFESQAYSFLDQRWAKRLNLPLEAFARLQNPVQEGVDLVRRDPIPSLLEQVPANLLENERGLLFECAKGYQPGNGPLPEERIWFGAVAWSPKSKTEDGPESMFGRMRSLTEDLLRCAPLDDWQVQTGLPSKQDALQAPWAHPSQSLCWHSSPKTKDAGRILAVSAMLDPQLREELSLENVAVGLFLLDLAALTQLCEGRLPRFESPARFPAIKVDVALALPVTVAYDQVEKALREAGGKLLEDLRLFDIFQGASLGEGIRSLAFHATLRSASKTLSEKDEQKFLKRVEAAAQRLGGNLRSC
ncbi:MAG: phenylalanine--tRNA ligase subunit beta [Planctomycetota bacterium]|nr:MAG: phenylalanine--tRNA ligase subunit beta [Planctomycetota bacterium]